MARKIEDGENAYDLARELLGDGNLYHELRIPGWNGDPLNLPVGQEARTQHERVGPPTIWAADPARLRRAPKGQEEPQ